ncbi:MAG: hypothetical protein ACQESG_02180 [Nanobdellota archaeon]
MIRPIFFLLLIPCVLGVGLSSQPLDEPILFTPGATYTIDYQIVGDDEVSLSLDKGYDSDVDMRQYAHLTPVEDRSFSLVIHFPENATVDAGGLQSLLVRATGVSDGNSVVGGTAIVQKLVPIHVYFDEKVIQSRFHVRNININETGTVEVTVDSWTHQRIDSVSADVKILGDESVLDTVVIEPTSLPSGESVTLTGSFETAGWVPGTYNASATINWDGNTTHLSDSFRIGSLEVDILNYTTSVPAGQISTFDIGVRSGWNDKLDDVFAFVLIDGRRMLKTATYGLNAWDEIVISDYIDTTGIEPGVHELKIVLHFGGEKKTITDSISIEAPPAEEQPFFTTGTILVVLAVALVGLVGFNVFWFMRHR